MSDFSGWTDERLAEVAKWELESLQGRCAELRKRGYRCSLYSGYRSIGLIDKVTLEIEKTVTL